MGEYDARSLIGDHPTALLLFYQLKPDNYKKDQNKTENKVAVLVPSKDSC